MSRGGKTERAWAVGMAREVRTAALLRSAMRQVRCPVCGIWFWTLAENLPVLVRCPACDRPLVLERLVKL